MSFLTDMLTYVSQVWQLYTRVNRNTCTEIQPHCKSSEIIVFDKSETL